MNKPTPVRGRPVSLTPSARSPLVTHRPETDPPPIACTLGAGDYAERLAWIATLNGDALLTHRRHDLTLDLTYAPEAAAQVRELVRREEACCAFLRFTVDVTSDAVHLRIEAPATAR